MADIVADDRGANEDIIGSEAWGPATSAIRTITDMSVCPTPPCRFLTSFSNATIAKYMIVARKIIFSTERPGVSM